VNGLTNSLGPSQVRQVYLVLAGVMRFAIRDGRMQKNPCDHIQLPRLVKKRRGYLTHAQVRLLASECGAWSDVIYFLAYTGLRWGEMAGIRVGRVDLSRRRVEIAEAVSEPHGVIIWGTSKNHSRRSVPFPEFLETMVKARSEGKGIGDVLFVGPDGGVLRAGNFRTRFFKPAIDRAKTKDPTFPQISIHDLRHTAASLAVSAGANVKAVQRMLGHASAAMTLDVYADLFDDDLDAVATAMNKGAIE
jgi:integrase